MYSSVSISKLRELEHLDNFFQMPEHNELAVDMMNLFYFARTSYVNIDKYKINSKKCRLNFYGCIVKIF